MRHVFGTTELICLHDLCRHAIGLDGYLAPLAVGLYALCGAVQALLVCVLIATAWRFLAWPMTPGLAIGLLSGLTILAIIGIALTGRQLDVQATVSADRKYVTMTIRTFTRVSGDPVPFQFTGGSLTGGAGFVQLVRQTTNQVQTTVSVPDGGTLLIGGLKQAAERERDAGVPILSRIPVLKRAFSNSSLVKDDSVLLILIKPKIIIQEEAEQEAFPTLSRGERS